MTSNVSTMARGLSLLAAFVAAVFLALVVPATDVELPTAPGALEFVEGNALVHPHLRMDRNWTSLTRSTRLRTSGPPRTVQ
jgi:hypothetical protein